MKNTTQVQLIDELNELYIDLTGQGISATFREELLANHGMSTIESLIKEKKHIMAAVLMRSEDQDVCMELPTLEGEADRCDSIEYVDPYSFQPEY